MQKVGPKQNIKVSLQRNREIKEYVPKELWFAKELFFIIFDGLNAVVFAA